MTQHRIVYITTPVEVADQIANELVDEDFARCVNIIDQVRSIYKWEGHVEHATESFLIVKTTADKTEALIEKVREIHPYEVPEIILIDIDAGNQDYLDWLAGKEIVVDESDLEDEDEDEEESEEENEEDEEEEAEG